MEISQIFESIQGEGRYSGFPALFIRTSGCTRECKYCDTKYHTEGNDFNISEITKLIKDSNKNIVVWTGGEPLIQYKDIETIINLTKTKRHHLETNGDLLNKINVSLFDYINCSPKCLETAQKIYSLLDNQATQFDIKIVTDCKELNLDLIPFATMLMPLTTYTEKDKEIKQRVWNYCSNNNIKYCLRAHFEVWGSEKSK